MAVERVGDGLLERCGSRVLTSTGSYCVLGPDIAFTSERSVSRARVGPAGARRLQVAGEVQGGRARRSRSGVVGRDACRQREPELGAATGGAVHLDCPPCASTRPLTT